MKKRVSIIVFAVVLATLVIVGAASAATLNSPLNYSGSPRSGYYCSGTNTTNHPVGERLAADYGVTYQEVMDRFCLEGYGFGEIKLAYDIAAQAGVSVSVVFDMRVAGSGWGNIMKYYGLHGNSGKTVSTTTSAASTTAPASINSTPVPPQTNGNGNANNHGQGNGQGHGKSKGKSK